MRHGYGFLCSFFLSGLSACSSGPVVDKFPSVADAATTLPYRLKSLPIPVELLEARVSPLPPLVNVRGELQLAYELNLANTFKYPFELKQIDIVDPSLPDEILHSFDSSYLERHLQRPGLQEKDDLLKLGGNHFGIVYLRMNFANVEKPKEVFHRLNLDLLIPDREPRPLTLELARIVVPNESRLVLAPPVRGGIWLYESEPHWVDRDLTEGRPSSAQRFAIDFVKLDDKGQLYNDKQGPNSRYVTYGEPLLAVADSEVIATKDDIIENDPTAGKLAVKGSRQNITGNYIMLDIGNDIVAVYAHLQPESLTVKRGDKVKQGDVIGLLGNSGNSDLPHLHFHLETRTDLDLTLSGDGIPYQFQQFNQAANFTIEEVEKAFAAGQVDPTSFRQDERRNEFPAKNGVIVFE